MFSGLGWILLDVSSFNVESFNAGVVPNVRFSNALWHVGLLASCANRPLPASSFAAESETSADESAADAVAEG